MLVKEQGGTLSNKDGMEHITKQVSCMYMHVCVYIDYAHMHDSLGNRTSMQLELYHVLLRVHCDSMTVFVHIRVINSYRAMSIF